MLLGGGGVERHKFAAVLQERALLVALAPRPEELEEIVLHMNTRESSSVRLMKLKVKLRALYKRGNESTTSFKSLTHS